MTSVLPADPRSWLFWSGLPLIAAQGLWLKARAYRAPEAPGPRAGRTAPEGTPLRLRALGDSIIAGVGLADASEALPAQLARALSNQTQRAVEWQALGRNGATARDALHLARSAADTFAECDLVLVSTGVNDVTGLRRRAAFAADLSELTAWLQQQSPRVRVVLCATPPLETFPLLPNPLRQLMGLRARQFDALVARSAGGTAFALHAPNPFKPEPGSFASDGFHPNADSVRRWGDWLSEKVLQRWPELAQARSLING